jgi:hypothetical protein
VSRGVFGAPRSASGSWRWRLRPQRRGAARRGPRAAWRGSQRRIVAGTTPANNKLPRKAPASATPPPQFRRNRDLPL